MVEVVKNNVKGALFALMAMGVYATHDAVIKTLGSGYSAFQIVFFAALLSFPVVTIILMSDKTAGTLKPVHPWWMMLRTMLTVITGISAFYAFTVLPLAQTYAILFSSPLLITILSIPVLGEKVGPHRWGAVGVGMIGVIIALQPGATELALGHLAALAAAICGASAAVIVRKIGAEERSVVMMLYPMIGNFVVMGCALPFFYKPVLITDMGLLAMIAIFGLCGGFLTIKAYRAGEAAIVAPMQYSQILWATLYGYLFFDETPTTAVLIGAAVIIASGIYIVLREASGGTSTERPVTRTRLRTETVTSPRASILWRIMTGKPSRKMSQ